MSTHAGGVVLVTSRVAGRPWGMTVTAFASVSVDPPTVLVSLGSDTTSARAIAATGAFGVTILGRDQAALAQHGATPGEPKFLEEDAVEKALASLDCTVVDAIDVADHVVFFGRVLRARRRSGGAPLLYHGREYLQCLAS